MEQNYRLHLPYYFRALKQFDIPGDDYWEALSYLEGFLKSKGVPNVVQYVVQGPRTLNLIYEDPDTLTTCIQINADGTIRAQNFCCSVEAWQEKLPPESFAADVFVRAVPSRLVTVDPFEKDPVKKIIPHLIFNSQAIYQCLLKLRGSPVCLQKADPINALLR